MYKIIGADQKEYGPISGDQIRQWVKDGRLNRQSPVSTEESGGWRMLGTIPEFADLFPAVGQGTAGLPNAGPEAKTSGMAVTSLVLGILGLPTCGITALVGLILGIIGIIRINRSEGRLRGNGLAIAGTCVSGAMLLILPVFAAMILPAFSRAFPAFAQARDRAQTINSVNNMKQLALAVRLYAGDHNDQIPLKASWCDAVQQYAQGPMVFRSVADPGRRCAYALNAKLDGKRIGEVNPGTVLLFESNAGWNGAGGPEALASNRHQRVVVALADGSVQQISPSQINSLRWDP